MLYVDCLQSFCRTAKMMKGKWCPVLQKKTKTGHRKDTLIIMGSFKKQTKNKIKQKNKSKKKIIIIIPKQWKIKQNNIKKTTQ